jgi:hypothetical protein
MHSRKTSLVTRPKSSVISQGLCMSAFTPPHHSPRKHAGEIPNRRCRCRIAPNVYVARVRFRGRLMRRAHSRPLLKCHLDLSARVTATILRSKASCEIGCLGPGNTGEIPNSPYMVQREKLSVSPFTIFKDTTCKPAYQGSRIYCLATHKRSVLLLVSYSCLVHKHLI